MKRKKPSFSGQGKKSTPGKNKTKGQQAFAGKKSNQTNRQKKQVKNKKRASSKRPQRTQKKRPRVLTSKKTHRKKGVFRDLLLALSITVTLFLLLFFLTVRISKVEGYSMTPTINDQDQLFIYRWGTIRRFSLVYLEEPETGDKMTRRVIGLPGEELIYQEGHLFINGEEIPERFLSKPLSDNTEPVTEDFTLKEVTEVTKIPENCYFVLGDNRAYATDSRYFGFVKKSEIVGIVKARIFPIHAMRQF